MNAREVDPVQHHANAAKNTTKKIRLAQRSVQLTTKYLNAVLDPQSKSQNDQIHIRTKERSR